MAVQDPFVLSHNIALNVNGRTKDLLTAEIQMASSKVFLTFCFYFFLTCLFCSLVCMIETKPSFWTTVGNHFLIWIQELAHALFYSIYKTFQNVKLRLLYRYINLLKFDLLKCGNPKRKNVVFCMICLF